MPLNIYEIFPSINGEVCLPHQGSLCTFIRLSGCNLRCIQCDTKYAQDISSGKEMDISEIMKIVKDLGNRNITITGGEPLIQKEKLFKLAHRLVKSDYNVSVETNGSIVPPSWEKVSWVVDYKLNSSGMNSFMNIENFKGLSSSDFIKFVVETKSDFSQAKTVVLELMNQEQYPTFAFSPCFSEGVATMPLKEWMEESILLKEIGAVFSLQIHKLFNWK